MRLSNPLSSFGLEQLIVESRPIKVTGGYTGFHSVVVWILRADISRGAQRICKTKKMNKDINMLLSSQRPLAFAFIETSQKILFLRKLMLTLSNLIKAERLHNLQASESMINKSRTNALLPSLWSLYNQGYLCRFVRAPWSPLVTS